MMSNPGETEAGPSTRSLRSHSPNKSAPSSRPTRARPVESDPSSSRTRDMDSPVLGRGHNRRRSAQSPVSDHTTSSRTVQSGPQGNSLSPVKRPRRTDSRRPAAEGSSSAFPSGPMSGPSDSPVANDAVLAARGSRSSSPLSSPTKTPMVPSPTPASSSDRKGKGRAVPSAPRPGRGRGAPTAAAATTAEKRVLPARIRRAAGGGAEGIRGLEEMIVDWLERWGEPLETPPDALVLHLTTLPFSLIEPPVSTYTEPQLAISDVTVASASGGPSTASKSAQAVVDARERIEVPSWVFVKAGEDDKEEAKDELETMHFGGVAGRGSASPVKRLRHATAEAPLEDTSDAYYIALHKKYEVFERRQRIREKETLQFERYRLRSRIDLLRGMSKTSWAAVVGVVLSRSALAPRPPPTVAKPMGYEEAVVAVTAPSEASGSEGKPAEAQVDRWAKGRAKLQEEGPDWLRDTLVQEGEELMKRYDQLLPAEHRKNRITDSPAPSMTCSPSLSPPPVTSNRVAALRDPSASRRRGQSPASTTSVTPRRLRLTLKAKSGPERTAQADLEGEGHDSGRKRKRASRVVYANDGAEEERQEEKTVSTGRRRRKPSGSGDYIQSLDVPASADKKARRSSLRSSTPLQPAMSNEYAGSVPPHPPSSSTVRSNASPSISIRISRSSLARPDVAPAPARAEETKPARSLRSFRTLVDDSRQGHPSAVIEKEDMDIDMSSDDLKELREVEAAVL